MLPAMRIPALDGFRGVAVLVVFFAHLFHGVMPVNQPLHEVTRDWMPGGGLVGVQMFFVLSGFLITRLLLRDDIDVLRFWARRLQRLYPALLVVSLATAMVEPAGVLVALTYTANFLPAGWLSHTWSLAVEEQFYLLWPLLLIAGWRIGERRGVFAVAVAGIFATVLARAVLDVDPDHLLRWDALLIGCAIAVVEPPRCPRLAACGFAVLAVCGVKPDWGMDPYLVTGLASGAAILGRHRWLESDILRYFGRVSYSLYLWHLVVMRFGLPWPVSVALSLIAAELSYRYVERAFWTPGVPKAVLV